MTNCSVTSFKKDVSEISERFCADSNSEKLDPLFQSRRSSVSNIRPDDMTIPSRRLSVSRSFEQFKVASVRTSWQHVRTLFKVREKFNVQVHPSGWCGNTVRTPIKVRRKLVFHCRHGYRKTVASVRTTSLHRPNTILDKARHRKKLQLSRRQGNTIRTLVLIMVIAWSRDATVHTLGQHRPDAALFRKAFQCIMENRLHSSLSGRPQLASKRRLEKTESKSI
jgi:hypothetical protein